MRKLLFLGLLVLGGCSEALKVSVRPSESEKDKPSAALTRRIEVSYHDGDGIEKLRESAAVIGLNQPVTIRKEGIDKLKIKADGIFMAKAYNAENTLILQGQALADPDQNQSIEIVLDRVFSGDRSLGSVVIRKVRLLGSSLDSGYEILSSQIRESLHQNRCLELPRVSIRPNSSSNPVLLFDTSFLEPGLQYSIDENPSLLPILNNSGGSPVFEFQREGSYQLKVYSTELEACFQIQTEVLIDPLQIQEHRGAGQDPGSFYYSSAPLLVYRLFNPNSFPVKILLHALVQKGGQPAENCFAFSDNPLQFLDSDSGLQCEGRYSESRMIPERSSISFSLYPTKDGGVAGRHGLDLSVSIDMESETGATLNPIQLERSLL